MTDFYEADEPVADILAARNRLPKTMTSGRFTIEVDTVGPDDLAASRFFSSYEDDRNDQFPDDVE